MCVYAYVCMYAVCVSMHACMYVCSMCEGWGMYEGDWVIGSVEGQRGSECVCVYVYVCMHPVCMSMHVCMYVCSM